MNKKATEEEECGAKENALYTIRGAAAMAMTEKCGVHTYSLLSHARI